MLGLVTADNAAARDWSLVALQLSVIYHATCKPTVVAVLLTRSRSIAICCNAFWTIGVSEKFIFIFLQPNAIKATCIFISSF